MTKKEIHDRIKKLRDTINHHRYLYHVCDQQEISESALDSLKHELYKLEQQYPEFVIPSSPTQRVGGMPLAKFEKVVHRYPMLSMEDVFSFDELTEWASRLKRFAGVDPSGYFCELKMDGVAVSLIYQDGLLVTGATRGDGRVGENVTENIKTVEAIPLELRKPSQQEVSAFFKRHANRINERVLTSKLSLSGRFEIRGEVFMRKRVLDQLNVGQEKAGRPLFANPRNATAGSIRQLDPRIAASRKLSFYGYGLPDEMSYGLTTHQQAHEFIQMLGIPINSKDALCASLDEVADYYASIRKIRESLPYWTDGVVAVVNDSSLFARLGVIGKTPRGIVAYKFAAEQVTTVLEDVKFQVGRTGALTPVAYLRPVSVAGTTVSHATLHNTDEIQRLDVMIGDTVIIEKAGDIIPKVLSVVRTLRPKDARPIAIPTSCPICGSRVERRKGEVALTCTNIVCFAKEKEAFIHFVSKKAFDIDGLGEKIVEQLIHNKLLVTPADLFLLTQGDVEPLERFAEKSAANLIAAIQEKKHIELSRFLYALGIRHVGEQTAIDLANHFRSIENIQDASLEELNEVANIGDVVAQSIHGYFLSGRHKALVHDLLANGVVIKKVVQPHSQPLAGKNFVLTGTLQTMTREEAAENIRAHGGKVSSSVSKETDYVVAGSDPGSKFTKAKKLGINILDEDALIGLFS